MENQIIKTKELRRKLDDTLQEVKKLEDSKETMLATVKIQEAIMWLGMNLKRLGNADPYPDSKNPNSGTIVHPTADGLKM